MVGTFSSIGCGWVGGWMEGRTETDWRTRSQWVRHATTWWAWNGTDVCRKQRGGHETLRFLSTSSNGPRFSTFRSIRVWFAPAVENMMCGSGNVTGQLLFHLRLDWSFHPKGAAKLGWVYLSCNIGAPANVLSWGWSSAASLSGSPVRHLTWSDHLTPLSNVSVSITCRHPIISPNIFIGKLGSDNFPPKKTQVKITIMSFSLRRTVSCFLSFPALAL